MINITVTNSELQRFYKNMEKFESTKVAAIRKEVTRTTYAIEKEAKIESPTDKGFLRNSIVSEIREQQITGKVSVKRNYGIFVHKGTKPHLILPRTRKVLAWRPKIGGKRGKGYVFSKLVHHPGTKANPFLMRAVKKEEPIFLNNIKQIFA